MVDNKLIVKKALGTDDKQTHKNYLTFTNLRKAQYSNCLIEAQFTLCVCMCMVCICVVCVGGCVFGCICMCVGTGVCLGDVGGWICGCVGV